ncbi:MAG: glycosyltransferase family 2 protein [Pseudomonadota bacterium]
MSNATSSAGASDAVGRPAGDRRLIITSMKNEGSYIVEWIAYHRVIGFTDFLVYTNDCDDSTVAMLQRLEEMGVLTHQPNKVLRRGPQKSALKWAKDHPLAKEADWILVSDIDEFLNVKVGEGTVQALIDHVGDADVIPVTWRLFSHADQIDYVDEPVIAQFTDGEAALDAGGFPDRFVKSLFRRQDEVERFGTHGPIVADEVGFVWRQPDLRVLGAGDNLTRPARAFAYDVAQFNHYAVCSVDNFLVKRDRGRVNHWRQVMGLDYWRRMCRGGEEDLTIQRWLAATTEEMSRLLADDELRAAHDAGVAWRKERIAALRALPEYEDMRAKILKLSEARDHHRAASAPSLADEMEAEAAPAPDQEDAAVRIKTLCAELRGLIERVEPHQAAEEAHARLDEIETGLFGKIARR